MVSSRVDVLFDRRVCLCHALLESPPTRSGADSISDATKSWLGCRVILASRRRYISEFKQNISSAERI
jgi:hypothetical protein